MWGHPCEDTPQVGSCCHKVPATTCACPGPSCSRPAAVRAHDCAAGLPRRRALVRGPGCQRLSVRQWATSSRLAAGGWPTGPCLPAIFLSPPYPIALNSDLPLTCREWSAFGWLSPLRNAATSVHQNYILFAGSGMYDFAGDGAVHMVSGAALVPALAPLTWQPSGCAKPLKCVLLCLGSHKKSAQACVPCCCSRRCCAGGWRRLPSCRLDSGPPHWPL